MDPLDHNPQLRFPDSVAVYDQMRRTDAQVGANLRAMNQTIHSFDWQLIGAADVPPAIVEFIRAEIGLVPADDARRRRRREGIVWAEHLREALMCLPLGFSVFEQVYNYSATDGLNHLRKLAVRPATTIEQINVGRDGGLEGIVQTPPVIKPGEPLVTEGPFIPVGNLVWYALDREGADWTGVSVLRTAYKAWFIKEKIERLSAQGARRATTGAHTAQVGDSVSEAERLKLSRALAAYSAGETAHLIYPEGVRLDPDASKVSMGDLLNLVKHFDQQISKSIMAMFLDLGHDNGARSLGEVHLKAFKTSCHSVAEHIAEVFTEHVIRDLVELNYGPDAPYPVLTPGPIPEDETPQDDPAPANES